MKAYRKRPGRPLQQVDIPNTLEALQAEVLGYIEPVHVPGLDCLMIVNEEGRIKRMPENFLVWASFGVEQIVGPALFIGQDGEEFADCPLSFEELRDWMAEHCECYDMEEGPACT